MERETIDWSKVNLDEIQLPEGEDFGIESEDEEEQQEEYTVESVLDYTIAVDNLPIVEPVKYQKLETVIRKIYDQFGTIRTLYMPKDTVTEKTLGYAFIEYTTADEALRAQCATDGYKLDKSHVFIARMFSDFEKYMQVTKEWIAPETECVSRENYHLWLLDEHGRDQFIIRYGSETEVFWDDKPKAELAYSKSCWTQSFVQWSPLGTYLATVHSKGAAIWVGCTEFKRVARFPHQEVRLIEFSPGERFLVTYSNHEPRNPGETKNVVLNIFDLRSGKCIKEFKGSAEEFANSGNGGISWPVFRWSGGREDKYFARIGKNGLSVYEIDTMKRVHKVDNVMDFSWSPTDSIMSLYVPERNGGNQPAKVSLMQIPSKGELRQKNLFNVSDCKMYWQNKGDYLAVKVERYTKTKKSTYTGFELFRIKERDIPIEVLELENKNHKALAFAWEPNGHRFAVIHGDGPRPDVSFYSMGPNNVTKLTTLKGRQADTLFWSPAGRFIVLAGLKSYHGQLEFYNVEDLQSMAIAEHFMATDVHWDPAGRHVATCVTSAREMENGFIIWSLTGKLLYKVSKDRFFQFLWRPRPPSLLSPETEEFIVNNLKTHYSPKYDKQDQKGLSETSSEESQRRKKMMEQWEAWMAEWKRTIECERPRREMLLDGEEKEEEYENEVEIEEVISVEVQET